MKADNGVDGIVHKYWIILMEGDHSFLLKILQIEIGRKENFINLTWPLTCIEPIKCGWGNEKQ